MAVAQDEDTQRRGIVGIAYYLDQKFGEMQHEVFRDMPKMLHWGPIRVSSSHLCVNNPFLRMSASIIALAFERDRQARIRIHDGKF